MGSPLLVKPRVEPPEPLIYSEPELLIDLNKARWLSALRKWSLAPSQLSCHRKLESNSAPSRGTTGASSRRRENFKRSKANLTEVVPKWPEENGSSEAPSR